MVAHLDAEHPWRDIWVNLLHCNFCNREIRNNPIAKESHVASATHQANVLSASQETATKLLPRPKLLSCGQQAKAVVATSSAQDAIVDKGTSREDLAEEIARTAVLTSRREIATLLAEALQSPNPPASVTRLLSVIRGIP